MNIWENIDKKTYDEIFSYSEDYKNFLNKGKTEREVCAFMEKAAREKGFKSLEEYKDGLKRGDKILFNNKNKSLVLLVLGENLEDGLHIVGSHIDSPRLDIKQRPMYEDTGICYLKTHYYGGIKKYQWPTIELALHGFFIDKNGKKHNIVIGEDENDPVFYINDLLPHLAKDQMKKTADQVITGEALNVVIGHSKFGVKDEKDGLKNNLLKILKEKYNFDEEDFKVAEFEVTPAAKARDVGLDRSMICGHGQDDRICSYANFRAILDVENPKKTAVALLVDKEEIGSVGNTAMSSAYFEIFLGEILEKMNNYSDLKLKKALYNSKVLSADVAAGLNPDYKDVHDEKNAPILGHGICMVKFTGVRGKGGSNDANAEFLYEIKELFNRENIIWQTGELGKVDQGGGGTIAYILAEHGAEVVDMGPAVLSMHAPIELSSKADAYMTYKAYKAFMK